MDTLLAAVTFGCGLAHHIVFVLQPDDAKTKLHKVFPIVSWAFFAIAMGYAVPWVSNRLENESWAYSLPMLFFLIGTWVGHLGITYLRGRSKKQRKAMAARMYMEVEEDSVREKRVEP